MNDLESGVGRECQAPGHEVAVDILKSLTPSQSTMISDGSDLFSFKDGLELDESILEGECFFLSWGVVLFSRFKESRPISYYSFNKNFSFFEVFVPSLSFRSLLLFVGNDYKLRREISFFVSFSKSVISSCSFQVLDLDGLNLLKHGSNTKIRSICVKVVCPPVHRVGKYRGRLECSFT
jgi:hypothetical protein